MRVKKFRGKTIGEAVDLMKEEFGQDAVILDTKHKKRGGFFGLFAKKYFEVIGAIDYDIADFNSSSEKVVESKIRLPTTNQMQQTTWSTAVQGLYDELIQLNLSHETALELVKSTLKKSPKKYWDHKLYLKEQMRINISSKIVAEESWRLGDERKVVALVGPTGVGKTTTIAKIAAKYQLLHNSSVGLITLDTYRMAAVEQLKTYAEIIGIPLIVAYNLEDLNQALADMADKDLVLVDTAGRSHLNMSQMNELKLVLKTLKTETYLVLNACTKNEDLTSIIAAYDELEIDRLIITKLDETSSFGILLQAPLLADVPIAFVTTGQSVPDDIEFAEANSLTRLVLGD